MAHIPRLYQAIDFNLTQPQVILDARNTHHVLHVLRMRLNDPIIMFNGKGGEYHGSITQLTKREVIVTLSSFFPCHTQSSLTMHLGQVIARGDKMDWIIQKAVELGVMAITPLFSERCGVKLSQERSQNRRDHWQSVIVSACEQCGRDDIPQLHPALSLSDWLNSCQADLKLIMHPHCSQQGLSASAEITSVDLLVGPEAGFSAQEVSLALQAGFQPIKLGQRILRTETASLVLISLLQQRWGDFGVF
ncbi:MAG: 16S rRNA (uracil(1498)-N(3))-methyltransferase [Gammaproteobacteria bacterium]